MLTRRTRRTTRADSENAALLREALQEALDRRDNGGAPTAAPHRPQLRVLSGASVGDVPQADRVRELIDTTAEREVALTG